MRMLFWSAVIIGGSLVSTVPVVAAENSLEITVKAGKYDRLNTPISVLVSVPPDAKSVTLTDPEGKKISGQLTAPGLRSGEDKDKSEAPFHPAEPEAR